MRLNNASLQAAIDAINWSNLNKGITGDIVRQLIQHLKDSPAEGLLLDGKTIQYAITQLQMGIGEGTGEGGATNDMQLSLSASHPALDIEAGQMQSQFNAAVNAIIASLVLNPVFSPEEKAKLAAINEHYRGTYISIEALTAAIPAGNAGDEAVIDAGGGTDAKKALWDSTDNKWVIAAGGVIVTDAVPTAESTNAVQSGGTFAAIKTVDDKLTSHTNTADEQKHTSNQIIEQAAHTLLSLPEQSKLNTVIAAIINYLSGTINASSINDPTWQLTEQRLAILQKLESGIVVSGAALLLDIFAPPGVEASLRDNTGWANETKTLTGDNSAGTLGYKGAHIWLNDAVFAECVDSSPTTAVYKRNISINELDPVNNSQDAAICNALDPAFTYPAMTATGMSTDSGWNLTSQVKVITGIPCRWGKSFVGGLNGDGYCYKCFFVNGATSYWKRTGTPSSIQLEIYATTHHTLTAHLLAYDFGSSAYTPVTGDEAAHVSQTFYDATTRGYYKKMINGNWEKLR